MYLAFNEVTYNLVVEIVNRNPFNALLHILLLFSFQSQLNEDLLQFLIHKIDAELLKSIFLHHKNTSTYACKILYTLLVSITVHHVVVCVKILP